MILRPSNRDKTLSSPFRTTGRSKVSLSCRRVLRAGRTPTTNTPDFSLVGACSIPWPWSRPRHHAQPRHLLANLECIHRRPVEPAHSLRLACSRSDAGRHATGKSGNRSETRQSGDWRGGDGDARGALEWKSGRAAQEGRAVLVRDGRVRQSCLSQPAGFPTALRCQPFMFTGV